MVITGFFELEGPIDTAAVRKLLEERLLPFERFQQRVAESRWGRPWWETEVDFDLDRHVVTAPLESPVTHAEFNRFIDVLAGTPLPPERPMWEVHVVEELDGGSAIVARLHHSIADGLALIGVLLSLCDDVPAAPPITIAPPRSRADLGNVRWAVDRTRHGLAFATATARLALLRPDPVTSLKTDLSGFKRTAWSEPFALDHLQGVARPLGATVNDVLLTAVSGALRSHFLGRGETIGRDVRAMVPFNLRSDIDDLGNRFGLVLPSLPVGEPTLRGRLDRVRRRMAQIKGTPEGAAAYSILIAMGWSGRAVETALVRFFAAKSSAVITNVPGPRTALHFGGRRIGRIMFWVPQAGGIGLGISLLSYAGSVQVGVLADTALLADPHDFVASFENELAAMAEIEA